MAWIIGDLNASERAVLQRRGWKIEKPDDALGVDPAAFSAASYCCYVDTDMFVMMDGPDWFSGTENQPERKQWREEVLDNVTALEFEDWLKECAKREEAPNGV